tara:strand:+ start:3572 stop:3784 length:213 start_codon:yes stop_codon:yes gene_type:complete
MKDKDIIFLNEKFKWVLGLTLRGEVVNTYLEAERILLKKEKINRRNCSCQYGALKRSVDSLYETWKKTNT